MKNLNFLVIILISVNLSAVSANWKAKTITNFNNGKIEKVRDIITTFQPYTDEDKSFIMYYMAKIQMDKTSTKKYLEKLSDEYQEKKYGQLGLLELVKLNILEKDFFVAQNNLDKVDDNIYEKFYWQTNLFYHQKKYESAIEEAIKFIDKSENHDLIELSYLLMVQSKIEQKKYDEALEILAEFKNSDYIEYQIAALLFKTGYCYEKTGKIEEAQNYYKKVINQFTYTKHSNDSKYRLQKLKNISNDNEIVSNDQVDDKDDGIKIYLQAGAFMSKKNAQRRVTQVKKLSFDSHIFEEKGRYKVAIGPFNRIEELQKAKKYLENNHILTFKISR
ncbi:MAG: SPOR domain-containing protein [Candidatus Cloacimonadota bacterium]|nr:SPOR domain-containing protein [Candidatus Cloacimonadota bacterium]